MTETLYKSTSHGFTLVEILVALVITSILTISIYNFFIGQHHAYTVQDQVIEMEQNARAALDMIRRDLRMAGFHAMGEKLLENLDDFVPSDIIPDSPLPVVLTDSPIMITKGIGDDPDMITFLTVQPKHIDFVSLKEKSESTHPKIVLNEGEGGEFRIGDMIHIGACSEYAKVTEISGDTLGVNVLSPNSELKQKYVEKTPVSKISVASYAVITDADGTSVLKRWECDNGDSNCGFQPVAENIINMKIDKESTTGELLITLSSRTDRPDHKFQFNNGYRTYTAKSRIKPRNGTVGEGSDCSRPKAPVIPSGGIDATNSCNIDMAWEEVTESVDDEPLESECEVTSYRVFYGTSPGYYVDSINVGNVTEYSLNLSGLNYCIKNVAVAAINSAGTGPKSENIPDNEAPAKPTDLTAVNINGVEREVGLSWNENTECDLQGYNVYGRSENADGFVKINGPIISKEFTNYADTNFPLPDPGGENDGCATYYYYIEAVDYCSNTSEPSDVESVSPTAPAPPTDPGFSTDGTTDTLSWTVSADDFAVDGHNYIVAYKVYDMNTNTVLATLDAGSVSWPTAADVYSNFGVSAVDACENESEIMMISSLCGEKPEINFVSPVDGTTVSGVIDIEATILPSEGRTIRNVHLKIENETDTIESNELPYTWDTTLVEDANYTVTVVADDSQGCYSQKTVTVTVLNSEVSEVIQDLKCKLYGCKAANNSVYLLSYVYDTDESKPVTGATVSVDIELEGKLYELLPADIFGYYGGAGDVSLPDGCSLQTDGGDSIQDSQITNKSKSALPQVNTITATVQKGEYSTTCSRTFGE